ncbi:MAG: hypothetical protein LBF86_00370 [Helicobacteraceae bacterium]|jgi:hypothetical protein|nr:hypothetical protein [Helicobacteraceae bacterium]
MREFTIQENRYLSRDITAFYHSEYVGYKKLGNPDYINTLKNTFEAPAHSLQAAVKELEKVLLEDLPQVYKLLKLKSPTICVVPRAKVNYRPDQLLFKSTVRAVIKKLDYFRDGANYIVRRIDTKTTHLKNVDNIDNDGPTPYPGITTETCAISSNAIKGKDILLIDDIYTKTINIDEDAIQALLDNGAKSVAFYAVGRTSRLKE